MQRTVQTRAKLPIIPRNWGSGQLEDEVKRNSWLTVPADDELLFDADVGGKWERALAKIGISPELLSADAGHA